MKTEQTDTQFKTLGDRLEKNSPARDKAVLVMLIGSADRQRLHGALRSRFDSNVGLAQARAEWVRTELVDRFPKITPQLRFLLLTSGPKKTGSKSSPEDLKEDRRVEVWALWGGSVEVAASTQKK